MKTVEIIFDGVRKLVPTVGGVPIEMPHPSYDEFDTYCGPGSIGDLFVPDDIDDIIISPDCFIHDQCFNLADPTWASFHHSNSVLLHNILTTLEYFGGTDDFSKEKAHRYYRAVTYYVFVDSSAGAKTFWRIKKRQELV